MSSSEIRAYTLVRDNQLYCLPSEIGTSLTVHVRWMVTERRDKTIRQTSAKRRWALFECPCRPLSCGGLANACAPRHRSGQLPLANACQTQEE